MERDWAAWHEPYDQPGSPLHRRLAIVQQRVREVLGAAPPGRVQAVSVCAGQGRDLIGVLGDHRRRDDVVARLVELDPRNVAYARRCADAAGLDHVEVVEGDAANTAAFDGAVPADLVLVCGVFGNISDADIRRTVGRLPMLCARNATVLWTRHRRPPDLTPAIRSWFDDAGFEEVAFDSEDDFLFGIGTHRLRIEPAPFEPGVQLFDFIGDGSAANL